MKKLANISAELLTSVTENARVKAEILCKASGNALEQFASEMWKITDETGEAVTELTDGMLYELRVTVAAGGDFDLSEAEKEIKLSVVLGK